MKLEVRSSKRIVEIPSEIFNKMTSDQQRSYRILDRKDSEISSEQIVTNEVVKNKKK